MANPDGNPDIASVGVKFSAGDGRPRGGDKAWSIRNQLRYLAAQRVDLTKEGALQEIFGDNPTVAQRAAFNTLLKTARTDADLKAIEFADERIDGKLLQPNMNADVAAIRNMTEEQLYAFIRDVDSAPGKGVGGAEVAGDTAKQSAGADNA